MDPSTPSTEKIHTDPVCGMKVAANPENSARVERNTYYFCSPKCRDQFNADPHQYLHRRAGVVGPPRTAANAPQTREEDVIYTCPMHPQIRQRGPGHCPICGMTLELL